MSHNTCPNPYGRNGGPEHRNKINEIGNDLTNRGYNVTYEAETKTPGGYKDIRFVDIYATNANETLIIQVGRKTKGGLPVIRERRALDDLISAGYYAYFIFYK